MKSKIYFQKSIYIHQLWMWMMASITLLIFGSCAHKIAFLTSKVAPAARGYVKVTKDNNHNFNIEVKLLYLAEVDRLQPPKETYIVWMVSEEEVVKNMGQVKSSTSYFSKGLKGSFVTVSSSKPNKIFITAEEHADTEFPSSKVILTTDRF